MSIVSLLDTFIEFEAIYSRHSRSGPRFDILALEIYRVKCVIIILFSLKGFNV